MTGSTRSHSFFCPTAAEASALRRAGVRDPIVVTGMGEEAMGRAVSSAAESRSTDSLFTLAGVAGGLSDSVTRGEAYWIEAVRGPESPFEHLSPPPGPSRRLCTVDSIVTGSTRRRVLHESTGCGLVDLEGLFFLQRCRDHDIECRIVRGVSDGVDDSLPRGCERMVDAQGRTRAGAVADYLIRQPWRLPALMRLSRRTTQAMVAVSELLR